jgi:hypothetical protein
MAYRADLGAPCAFDPVAFTGPESNSTALAIVALRTLAVPTSPVDWSDGIEWLQDNRQEPGGWGFFPGDPVDPNSTALGMQALVTPTDRSVYSSAASTLGTFQLACDSEADPGAFEVSFAPGAGDLIATTQAVAVLALDANTEPDEAPADDAGLVAPTAPCVAVADVLQPPRSSPIRLAIPWARIPPELIQRLQPNQRNSPLQGDRRCRMRAE